MTEEKFIEALKVWIALSAHEAAVPDDQEDHWCAYCGFDMPLLAMALSEEAWPEARTFYQNMVDRDKKIFSDEEHLPDEEHLQ